MVQDVLSPATDRARATLLCLAAGDALGMPSQTLPREVIRARYGRITTFVAPFADHPVSHGLRAGQVTDDTEQTLLLAHRLLAAPDRFDARGWSRDLLAWERDVRARGLRDLLGPSSRAALDAMLAGTPVSETGRNGTTNGAAMRIAPAGIATPHGDVGRLVDHVTETCQVTHNTGEAIAAAAAVAMVVSQGIDGASFEQAVPRALQAAMLGQKRGHATGHGDVAGRIRAALDLAASGATEEVFAATVGTSVASAQSVAAAFGLVRMAGGAPWGAALIAANIGDDTDTIGAIAGAMAGACCGSQGVPPEVRATLMAENCLPIDALAADLVALRMRRGAAPGFPAESAS